MLQIELKDFDDLYRLMMHLGAITYLQSMILFDKQQNFVENDLRFASETAEAYLLDMQSETVLKLKRLLERQDFSMLADQNKSSLFEGAV